MRLRIQGHAQFGFVIAILALMPTTASAHGVIDRDAGPGTFTVSLAEARFTGSGGHTEDHGFLVSMATYEFNLTLVSIPGSPFRREVSGRLVIDSIVVTPFSNHGDRKFINLTGTICLDPNTGIILGEGTFETVGMLMIRDGEPVSPLISFPPGAFTGTFRFVAILGDSGVDGTIEGFHFIWDHD
jgi:hypothetical protein